MTRGASESVRVTNWFTVTGNQLDFVQFTDQTLTSADINALFGSGLMSSAHAAGPIDRPADRWDRSLAVFVDAMNHFGQPRNFVVEHFGGTHGEMHADWVAPGQVGSEMGARFREGVADRRHLV
jgi:hypothetical protein